MSESLRSLSDHDILSRTQALTSRERKITLSLLLYLNEVERRRLHLKLGHGTLFDYCTTGLGYSASAAMRRIQAARCIATFPEVRGLLEGNELNLSTVCIAARVMNAENKHALLERVRGKSQREVEAIAAEFEPREAMPKERVRTIVVRQPVQTERRSETAPLFSATHRPGRESAAEPEPIEPPPALEKRTMLQFSADDEFMTSLERLRSIAWHRIPANASLEQVFKFALDYFLKREDPQVRHEQREVKSTQRASKQSRRPRHVPAGVRDQVFIRDQGHCTFVGETACGPTHGLQLDHKVPVALGGEETPDNLRLRCAKHNRLEAERVLGLVLP